MVDALVLLVLRCSDVERSRRFYEALGMVFRREKLADGPEHYTAEIGGTVIQLFPRKNKESTGARLGFRVLDLDWVARAAERNGGKVVRFSREAGMALISDPDGHRIELMQKK